jgi:hypothetical protein
MLRLVAFAVLLCALCVGLSGSARALPPTYSTAGRYQPANLPPSWKTYQNYRGYEGYNVRRRSDEYRRWSPQYRATSMGRLYQY